MTKSPPVSKLHVLQEFFMALVMADFCLFWQWSDLNRFSGSVLNNYQLSGPSPDMFIAIWLNLALVTGFFFILIVLCRKLQVRKLRLLTRALFLFFVAIGLWNLRNSLRAVWGSSFLSLSTYGPLGALLVLSLVIFLGVMLIKRKGPAFLIEPQSLRGLFLFFLPLPLYHLGWSIHTHLTYDFGQTTLAQKIHVSPSSRGTFRTSHKRVVWIIFDTLEQRYLKKTDPQLLPHLNHFMQQSFKGESAFSPGTNTLYSLSSYLVGKKVSELKLASESDLKLKFEDSEQEFLFSKMPNIFESAFERGLKTSVVGWAHPYCRIFGHYIQDCTFLDNFYTPDTLPSKGVFNTQLHYLSHMFPRVPRPQHAQISTYKKMLAKSLESVGDPSHDFVFLHFNIPHGPWIYHPEEQRLAVLDEKPSSVRGHTANLQLVDKTLGELLAQMEKAKLLDKTLVIVSSDHFWWHPIESRDVAGLSKRLEHPYNIPFLVRFPSFKTPHLYSPSFNTVMTKDIIEAYFSGQITSPISLSHFIDTHRDAQFTPILESHVWGKI